MHQQNGLSVPKKVTTTEKENAEKKTLACFGNTVSYILRSKTFGKTEPKWLAHLNRADQE